MKHNQLFFKTYVNLWRNGERQNIVGKAIEKLKSEIGEPKYCKLDGDDLFMIDPTERFNILRFADNSRILLSTINFPDFRKYDTITSLSADYLENCEVRKRKLCNGNEVYILQHRSPMHFPLQNYLIKCYGLSDEVAYYASVSRIYLAGKEIDKQAFNEAMKWLKKVELPYFLPNL